MNSTKTEVTKPKLNVRLLRRVQKHILAEPRRLAMDSLAIEGEAGERIYGDNTSWKLPSGGTAACIAGWACSLSGKSVYSGAGIAGMLLGLPYSNETYNGPADKLFFTFHWPQPFKDQYANAKTPAKRAKIAAARIEHLISTGE